MGPRHVLSLLDVAAGARALLSVPDPASAEAERQRATLRARLDRYHALPNDVPMALGVSLLSWAEDLDDVLLSTAHLAAVGARLTWLRTQAEAMRKGPSKAALTDAVELAEGLANVVLLDFQRRVKATVANEPEWEIA